MRTHFPVQRCSVSGGAILFSTQRDIRRKASHVSQGCWSIHCINEGFSGHAIILAYIIATVSEIPKGGNHCVIHSGMYQLQSGFLHSFLS